MSRVDESIMTALRDRAEGGVHVEELLAGARHRGQRRRLVRRTAVGAGVGVLALAVIGGVAMLPLGEKPGLDNTAGPPATSAPAVSPAGRPPIATGAPALGEGGTAGTDGLFHLDHDVSPSTTATWESGSGWELMHTSTPPVSPDRFGADYTAAIGDSTANLDKAMAAAGIEQAAGLPTTPLTIGGRPATFGWSGMHPADGARWGYIRWQPVAGTWAQVFDSFADDAGTNGDTDEGQLLKAVATLRFDRVYRCAVDFRLTWVPPNATVTSCAFNGGERQSARVHLSSGAASFSVSVASGPDINVKPVKPNTDYAGTPMEYTDAGRVRLLAGDRLVIVDQLDVLLAKADALHLAAAVEPITTPDPADWPSDPLR